jgi:hypothetical protein
MWKPIVKVIDKLHYKYGTKVINPTIIKTETITYDTRIMSTTISSAEHEKYYIDGVKEELACKLANDLLENGYIKFSRYSLNGEVVCDDIYEPSNYDRQDILTARLDVIRRNR